MPNHQRPQTRRVWELGKITSTMKCKSCDKQYQYNMQCPQCLAKWIVHSYSQQGNLNRELIKQYEAIHGKDAANVIRAHANRLKSQRN